MCVDTSWADYFKKEVQIAGDDLVKDGLIFLSVASDTSISGLCKTNGNPRVEFISKSISAEDFRARCTCSRASKGIFCKHIWALLKMTQKKHPDFLSSKCHINLEQAPQKSSDQFKQMQKTYQKEQREKIKALKRNKSLAQKITSSKSQASLPLEVQKALEFFKENGFDLANPPEQESLKEARKILSRVFHPDKGGSHEESLLLNKNFDVIADFFFLKS